MKKIIKSYFTQQRVGNRLGGHFQIQKFSTSRKLTIITIISIILLTTLIISQPQEQCNTPYMLFELQYKNQEFNLINKSLETGCPTNLKTDDNFEYEYTLSTPSEEFFSASFDPTIIFIDTIPENQEELKGGSIPLEQTTIYLTAPYNKEAENFEILKQGEKVFETNIKGINSSSCRID